MLDRTAEQFDLAPSRVVADAGYGSAEMLGWLVDERGIEPHVKVFDKSERKDGTFSRSDFAYDAEANVYVCPGGKELKKFHRNFSKPRDGLANGGRRLNVHDHRILQVDKMIIGIGVDRSGVGRRSLAGGRIDRRDRLRLARRRPAEGGIVEHR